MSYALAISDETAYGQTLNSAVLHFPAETISVKTLIETRVAEEIERQQDSLAERFYSLVRPKDAEETLNGYRMKKPKHIDVAKQQALAIKGFGSNGFFLLVNDKQLTELDDEILITPKTKVSFIKLVPLVGG